MFMVAIPTEHEMFPLFGSLIPTYLRFDPCWCPKPVARPLFHCLGKTPTDRHHPDEIYGIRDRLGMMLEICVASGDEANRDGRSRYHHPVSYN